MNFLSLAFNFRASTRLTVLRNGKSVLTNLDSFQNGIKVADPGKHSHRDASWNETSDVCREREREKNRLVHATTSKAPEALTFETTLAVSDPVAATFHAIFLADRPFLPPSWGPRLDRRRYVKIVLRKSSRLGGTREEKSRRVVPSSLDRFHLFWPSQPAPSLRLYVSLLSYRSVSFFYFHLLSSSFFSFLPFPEKIVAPSATTGEILAAPSELKDLLNHRSSTVFRPVLLIVQPAPLFSTPPSARSSPPHPVPLCFPSTTERLRPRS